MSDNIFFQSLELLDASKLTPQELAIITDLKEYVQSNKDKLIFYTALIELSNNRIMELAPATDPTIILF